MWAQDDVYLCPAGERLVYHYTNEERGLTLRRYWTTVCRGCAIRRCTTGKERRITRWQHEHVLEAVQRRLDEPMLMTGEDAPAAQTVGILRCRTINVLDADPHFQMKTLKRVGTEMALHVLAYGSQTRHQHHEHRPC